MRWWNRALVSLKYRWKKNLLLCLVIVTAMSLLLPAGAMQGAADRALTRAQEEIPACVYMMKTKGNWDSTLEENYYSMQLAQRIAALPQVKRASHMTAVNVYSDRVRGIDVCDEVVLSGADSWKEPQVDPESGEVTEGWMQIVGVTELNDYWDFKNCGAEIVEGQGITSEDTGRNIMVLAQKTASDNQIRMGEMAKFRSYYDPEAELGLELAGLHNGKIWHGYGNAGHSANYIYVPLDTALELYDGIMESRYELKNAEELSEFLEAAQKAAQESGEEVKFVGDSIHYLTTSAALKNVQKTGYAVILSVLLMAGMIISLLVVYSLMERKRERDILWAMGESRIHMAGQMCLELLLPIGIALAVSIIAGSIWAKPLADMLLGKVLSIR